MILIPVCLLQKQLSIGLTKQHMNFICEFSGNKAQTIELQKH